MTINYQENKRVLYEDDNFGRFLKDELIPFIEKNYPTKPYRVFVGHSLGGLRVAHTALYEPDLFDAFLIVDGSLNENNFEWYESAKKKMKEYNPNLDKPEPKRES